MIYGAWSLRRVRSGSYDQARQLMHAQSDDRPAVDALSCDWAGKRRAWEWCGRLAEMDVRR